ncbi:IS1595 family transposase [Neisseria lisongii]|uniref:IS1595 family transposase n=1 Tax=Neisseria lisongii TaxID=2912188 RepID=A0AAW5AKK0_9NEIS|nr:IS1595 family transposase [Neisseria lisongii]MCF7529014.1 IS1595 family transposase [Neisseria lisongii]
MAQHYLLSSGSNTISAIEVARMSDDEAFDLFCKLRWGGREVVCCPRCGLWHKAYWISTRRQWRCRGCGHTFSVTSGTIFANRKKPLQTYLFSLVEFVNSVKGLPALQLCRNSDMKSYGSNFALLHKIRKVLWATRDTSLLENTVDMDGTYVHTCRRKENKKVDRVDQRLRENENPDKCCVIVAREHYSDEEKAANFWCRGAKRTVVTVAKRENPADVLRFAHDTVKTGACIHTDESHAYKPLKGDYVLETVSHKHEYCSDEGVTNNQAESYFSRFKRFYYGQVHKMSSKYLLGYAQEVAFREDNRRTSNREQFCDLLSRCLSGVDLKCVDDEWQAFWQDMEAVSDSADECCKDADLLQTLQTQMHGMRSCSLSPSSRYVC